MTQSWTDDIPDVGNNRNNDLSDIDTNLMTLKSSFKGSTEPSSKEAGVIWYDDSESPNQLKVWTGSEWRQIAELPDLNKSQSIQGNSELDLTTNDTADVISKNKILAARGGDELHFLQARAIVTTAIAADTTAPVVEIRDNSNNTLMTINSFVDGDSVATLRKTNDDSDGTTLATHDLTSEKVTAKVTTAASDSGTATGNCKLEVEFIPLE